MFTGQRLEMCSLKPCSAGRDLPHMNFKQSPTLRRVLAGQLCTGCGLCAGISPNSVRMETVAPGFSRPRQTAPIPATEEQKIASACPGSVVAPWGEAPHRHVSWGPWRQIFTGHACDEELRFAGSSGGALSALLIHALRTGRVDRVLHIAADPDRPTRNVLNPAGEARAMPAKFFHLLRAGETIRHEQAGGGGFGDPLARDPELVAADARNEKITLEYARREHGVVLDPVTLKVDADATRRLREVRS